MNFHVRDDFKAGAPVSQVPASWYNAVAAFINNLVGGRGIELDKKQNGTSVIALKDEYREVSRLVGTAADHTDSPTVLDNTGDDWTWSAGGANGLKLDCYCTIAPQTSGSNYSVLQRCRMTFSKDGLLVKAELLDERVRLKAKNG